MEPREYDVDVLVVGAGPTGLVLATELLARGVSCRVVDKAAVRSDKSRALVVQARSLELLEKMGAVGELLSHGRRGIEVSGFVGKRRFLRARLDGIGAAHTPYPFMLFVSQAVTERVLDHRLAELGSTVERPVELLSFAQDEQGVTATLRNEAGKEQRVRARYLVGCDGAHSAVRKEAGLRFDGAPYPQEFVLADVAIEWSEPADQLAIVLARRGAFVVFPLGEAGFYRIIASRGRVVTAPNGADAADPTLEEIQHLADEMGPVPMRVRDPRWIARFRLHHRGVDRYRNGRAFVAGDAAHIHSPAGGQGMNTGIQDAYNLAWKLALVLAGRADDRLLDSYHEERHPVGQKLLEVTDRMFSLASSSSAALVALRNLVVPTVIPAMLSTQAGRARAFRFISQLGIRYRHSSIVQPDDRADAGGWQGGPRPGDRAPDAPLRGPDGEPTTVFARTADPSHHVLAFGDAALVGAYEELRSLATRYGGLLELHAIARVASATPPAGIEVCLDETGVAHQRYGVRADALYLLRPDGHVAFRTPRVDTGALGSYLDRLYRSPGG